MWRKQKSYNQLIKVEQKTMGVMLEKIRLKKGIGRNRFSNRVVDEWNEHSCQVVFANSLESFER